mgnify:CR=1 FL=1
MTCRESRSAGRGDGCVATVAAHRMDPAPRRLPSGLSHSRPEVGAAVGDGCVPTVPALCGVCFQREPHQVVRKIS